MSRNRPQRAACLITAFPLAVVFGLFAAPAAAQTCATSTPSSVLTAQYSPLRQAYNRNETLLSSNCLSSGTVALSQPAWSPLQVDEGPGQQPNWIQAQPLYVAQQSPASPLPNCPNPCNMLIAVTLTDSVFAWNADTGAPIWSDCQGAGCTNNALWVEDCGPSGGVYTIPSGGSFPFFGIVSTPVIDTNASPPVIYLTSFCVTGTGHSAQQWWIHELNLYTGLDQVPQQQITGITAGTDDADGLVGSTIAFTPWNTLQRPALLEVRLSGTTGNPNPLIYVAFGYGQAATENSTPYHGWVYGYDSSLTQRIGFVTTSQGGGANNTNLPACTANCTCNSNKCTVGEGCIATNYVFPPNWCGHGGGIWMSGRGPAANTDSSGVSHAYFGVGNGGFQQTNSEGKVLATLHNWSNSILDFRLGASVFDSSPGEYFTPYGGPQVPLQQSFLGNEPGGNPVGETVLGLNQNDLDLSVGGLLLFNDLSDTARLITIDKAGYGYMLTQGNLCGSPKGCHPGAAKGAPGGRTNDPGNAFSFAANLVQCPDEIATLKGEDQSCHRVTSMAFYPDGSPERLYVWPSYEGPAAFALSNNTPSAVQPGTISVNGTSVTGSGTSFQSTLIPGDTFIACGCTPGVSCPIVTAVGSNTSLTLSSSLNATGAWQYSGYFTNPVYGQTPTSVQYAGGGLTVTSANGANGVLWGQVKLKSGGALFAYDAETLNLLWCSSSQACTTASSSTFTNATFAVPTIANGHLYIPTAGISQTTSNAACTSSAPCSGILVYAGQP